MSMYNTICSNKVQAKQDMRMVLNTCDWPALEKDEDPDIFMEQKQFFGRPKAKITNFKLPDDKGVFGYETAFEKVTKKSSPQKLPKMICVKEFSQGIVFIYLIHFSMHMVEY